MALLWLIFIVAVHVVQPVDGHRINSIKLRPELYSPLPLAQQYRGQCNRQPLGYNTPKTPGDNGFQINISGDPQKYVPGKVYTISLQGSTKQHNIQKFTGFTLVVEPKVLENDFDITSKPSPNTGFFQLFGDALSKFSEECPHAIVHTSVIPKSEIQVMWTAPPSSSGCVVFKATILEFRDVWYMDDGGLTKELCEEEQEIRNSQSEIIEDCCACDEAKYEVVFEGLWSRHTHPKDFPSNEWRTQFFDIIGSSHTVDFRMWEYGGYATEGVRQLVELGSPKKLESELKTESEKIRTIIKARGLQYPNLNGKTFAVFRVDKRHHLMSLLSKLSPSPDWLVGVSALELCLKNCSWVANKIMNLYPWDAGINDGLSYLSDSSPTLPQERIKRITSSDPSSTESPFYDPSGTPMKPVARLIITRQRIYEKPCEEPSSPEPTTYETNTETEYEQVAFGEDPFYPNLTECAVSQWTEYSRCSVSCGYGSQLRTRTYINEENARKMECVTNVVEDKACYIVCEGNVSCQTSDWSEWTPCNISCGTGTRTRRRQYLNLIARKVCRENLVEKGTCMEVNSCKINTKCAVTQWSGWSPCTVTCGRGMKFRTRLYLIPSALAFCNTELMQKTTCEAENPTCISHLADAKEICMMQKDMGPCRGLFKRWYYDTDKQSCIQFVYGGCRGNKNNFHNYFDCRRTCQDMLRDFLHSFGSKFTYKIDNILIQLENGEMCVPLSTLATSPSRGYNQNSMHVIDCQVSEWSEFSSCSATCGKARRRRYRRIEVHPQNGGAECPKKLVQRRKCKSNPKCPVDCKMTSWSQWSPCSVSCGPGGFQKRVREIKREPKRGGLSCKPLIEEQPCNQKMCHY
ncbi:spondin-1-like isoform X2 [Limulus polyphemus]|uniref:Spondin-1 n=1 Tax=Limulus polyphemus TaxID=6850 RepID=A0ABM1T561_LIMPO|nr:spondin-1-like isoform X2 [Limulus polyphemus]